MSSKRQVTANPRTLQHIAFIAVVLFGLVMASAIHITQKTVEKVQAHQPTSEIVVGTAASTTTAQ